MRILEVIAEIDWFANVGNPIISAGETYIEIANWRDAIASCSEQDWEDVCLNESNLMTTHLNYVCKDSFQRWNDVINDAKLKLDEPWKRMRLKLEQERVPEVVAHCVEWDTVHAVAYEHFASWGPPTFFLRSFAIYRGGNFPCGWQGAWPSGIFKVF